MSMGTPHAAAVPAVPALADAPAALPPAAPPPTRSEALSTSELCAEVARLCALERRTEWLLCRHLAELADRFESRAPGLGAYADVYQLARARFDMGVRRARERVRIGRALRALPRIEAAFVGGRVGYARVRELTRVATGADEEIWLRLARDLPLRVLERRVVQAAGDRGERDRAREPADVRWTSPESVELRLVLPAATWALLQRALEGARRQVESSLSDAEALEAVAREALAGQTAESDRGDVRNMVVFYECASCRRTELETGAGAVELDPAAAAARTCGATACALADEGRAVTVGGAIPAAVRRAVLLRDRARCRAPGCTRRRFVDVHHVRHREHGGEHSRSNCVTLCTSCHERVHDGRLVLEGDAERELVFRDARGDRLGATPGGHDRPSQAHRSGRANPGDHDRPGVAESPAATRLLATMGTRGGWHPDHLVEATGLDVRAISCALLELEIAGRVRAGVAGYHVVQ